MKKNIGVLGALTGLLLPVAALTAVSDVALAQPGPPVTGTRIGAGSGTSHSIRTEAAVVGEWRAGPGGGAKRVDSLEVRADGTFELRFAYYCPPGAMCFVGPRAPDHGTWTQSGEGISLAGESGTYSGRVRGDVMELDGEVLRRVDPRR
ncbi:hypothetical protein ACFXPM_07725 [Streptomyces sp. NPDC059095]|uniref:hypothetical protein n=1 Tax=Streptomyces sp. NPDC059095 TaxID=3346726 RepID=UPI00367AB784